MKQTTTWELTAVACCAELAHEANRIYCAAIGDMSQKPWASAEPWQRDSAMSGVYAAVNGATPEQLHEKWCDEKRAAGWVHGSTKDADKKIHPCLVPYADLPPEQRVKDALFSAVVNAMNQALISIAPESP